ncbi:MAG: hypothetical protein HXY34_13875 [Candidatus Thorarchaeota archaeon]|nr:hypothetical protein [Candidatus Thorarchaeota archaeon]
MTLFEQEWVSPILEVYKKRRLTENPTVILGLNPLGHAVCRRIYESLDLETVFVFNSSSFSVWNRYPSGVKPPVVPVHGMTSEDLMIVFGDVFVKEYEWVTDMLFYLMKNVNCRFVLAFQGYEGPTCAQTTSEKGTRLAKRMGLSEGAIEFFDGLTAPLISLSKPAGVDTVAVFVETMTGSELIYQVDDVAVTEEEILTALSLLEKGLGVRIM